MRHAFLWLLMLAVCVGSYAVPAQADEVIASTFCHPDVAVPDVPPCVRVEDDAFRKAVLVGDSLADGLAIHNVIPQLQLLSRIGLSPRTALTNQTFKNNGKPVTLREKLPVMRPTAVYFWLGSNGLDAAPDAERILYDYGRMLDRLLPALQGIPVYLLEITPVQHLTHERYSNFTNELVDTFNEGLRALAQSRNVYLLPINALLKDADGMLRPEYAAEDGIHLRGPAYEIIAEYLYTHVLPPLPEEPEPEAET